MSEEIHRNDIGTKFLVTILDDTSALDISTASEKKIIFKKSNGFVVEKTAEFNTDGSDGKVYYTTVADDLSITGIWSIQAKVVLPTGTWRSDTQNFEVYSNLE